MESLEKWRAEMGITEMVLCGHSLGGMMASAYAMAHPNRSVVIFVEGEIILLGRCCCCCCWCVGLLLLVLALLLPLQNIGASIVAVLFAVQILGVHSRWSCVFGLLNICAVLLLNSLCVCVVHVRSGGLPYPADAHASQ